MQRPLLPALFFALLFLSPAGAAAAPRVAVSIMPIHSLVAGVMDGVGEPSLVVKGGASPHFYSLRPSDAEALERAEIVFWVGPTLESFLVKPLESLAGDAITVALLEQPSVLRLEAREGGTWEEHDHGHGEEHGGHKEHGDKEHGHKDHDDHGHKDHGDGEHGAAASAEKADAHDANDHDEVNPHIWLDPENARRIVRIAVETLSVADPENAARYGANGEAMETRLDALEAEVAAMLIPVANRPYVVFHDAYPYFEERFETRAIGSISVGGARKPGARRLEEIRAKIMQLDAGCVFAEPQFEPALVDTIIEGTGARAGVLDPLGADLAPGPDAYFDLIRNIGGGLRDCLGREG
jgi:zinc transport system substrate-binding protein